MHLRQSISATRPSKSRGFTLIEIMIVVAIIALILAVGAPRLFNSATIMRAEIRKLAVSTREIRNVARLFNSTQRLVIDMNEKEGHTYWVEGGPANATLMTEEQRKELERLTTSQQEDVGPRDQFKTDTRVVRSPVRLPKGLFFGDVEYASDKKEIAAGKAYVHFFPQGIAEEVAIHLTDKKSLNWTITINPLTGRAAVFERKVSLKELRQ